MAFKKGNKLAKGREAGSKNVKTLEWEEFGKAIVEGNLPWMKTHLETLKKNEPEKAFDLIVELMEYFKPKLSRQELKAPPGSEMTYTLKFK